MHWTLDWASLHIVWAFAHVVSAGRDLALWVGGNAAELLVALVIYMEVEGSRLDRFYEHTLDASFTAERREIFDTFLRCDSPRPDTFLNQVKKDGQDAAKFRHLSEKQIAWFQRMGAILPWFPPNRATVLNWFPQAVVYMWLIFRPYIELRRLTAGDHWAFEFERLAGHSAKYLLKRTRSTDGIVMESFQVPGAKFRVSSETLRELARLRHGRLWRRVADKSRRLRRTIGVGAVRLHRGGR